MSIIQTIRDKAALVVFVIIAISLIAFILQDAFTGRTSSLFNELSATVGSVNGKTIDRETFDARIRQTEQAYQAQGAQLDEAMRQNIYTQIWNATVDQTLLEQEAEKLGLNFTPKEMSDLLFSERAPQEFKQQFTNPETGVYDIEAARTAFRNLQKSKNADQLKAVNEQLIQPLTVNQLRQKYSTLIGMSMYIPKWLIEKMNAENSGVSRILYTGQAYATIADSSVLVTDAEINEYISKHKDDFKQDPTRSISYVVFDATPSAKDSLTLISQLENLKAEFKADTNARAFLNRNQTAIPLYDGYVLGSRMQMQNKDSIRQLPVGEVFGPYYDAGNYVLAKKLDTRQVPDSVKVRHILISTVDPRSGAPLRSDSAAQKTADSIEAAVRGGADFAALALQLSDDEGSKTKGGEYEFSSNDFGNLAREFAEATFYGKAGDKKVIKTQFGYHYFEVMSQRNFETGYKVAYLSKPLVPSQETDDIASTAATKFAADSRDLKAFDENVTKLGYNKRLAEEIREMDFDLPGVGVSRSMIRWIFENKVGSVSDPFPLSDSYVVVAVTGAREKGTQTAATARTNVEPIIRNQKKARQIAEKLKGVTTLEDAASKLGSSVNAADSVRFTGSFVPGLGAEPKIIGAAFNKAYVGKVSSPIEGNMGVFVIRVEETGALPSANANVAEVQKAMIMQQRQFAVFGATQALRTAADIEDNRRKAGY